MRTLAIVAIIGAGCGGDCEPRTGAYRVTFTERAGDCGPVREHVFVAGSPGVGGAGQDCDNRSRESADHCTVTVDVTCADDAERVAYSWQGEVEWSANGAQGTGTAALAIADGYGVLCSGTYDVEYARP